IRGGSSNQRARYRRARRTRPGASESSDLFYNHSGLSQILSEHVQGSHHESNTYVFWVIPGAITMKHCEIEANGIFLHFVEEGQGPAVVFCHGFPAIWSSWKAQMEGVASAVFKAIAPDMRGYGGSSAPVEAEAYTPYRTVGDLVAILDAAGVA